MRVLLVTDYFYPQSSGGTEKYVYELAQALRVDGIDVIILTISYSSASYQYDQFDVHTIPPNTDNSKTVIAGVIPANNLQSFINKLSELKANVVHFHTLTTSISTYHYQAAKQTGAKVIFTSHIPGNTCLRGDLMRYGKEICDGKVRLNTCLSCYLNARGLPKSISPISAKIMRVLKQPPLLSQASSIKKDHLEKIKTVCSTIVTMSNWQQDVFLINAFNPGQLNLSRHTFKQISNQQEAKASDHITIGFAGRISPEKGLHILMEAFKQLDTTRFTLLIAAIKVPAENKYLETLLSESEDSPNIKWDYNYTPDNIGSFYKQLNVLCIPSVCNETGPYVMFESIARHIPVIASNLGGMREWAGLNYPVTTYQYDDSEALAKLLNNLPAYPNTKFNYPPQRTQTDLAQEMIAVYNK
ncbi:glycosyltransferase [Mucilaginibacter sp. E4BP6]|uniref:glycosyltransferase n=1 Tax=Mucilaginibacter sp. E4BP6 TaxID=2723089 RepID=UPI0015C79AB7|nr:glycosyltransferase [Mucilaginibacter sp. E4BP6]NYE67571.1 glycosyltransferase involved in cell wall biosynthesis [Mucilaginibacter sp. E4BP6]